MTSCRKWWRNVTNLIRGLQPLTLGQGEIQHWQTLQGQRGSAETNYIFCGLDTSASSKFLLGTFAWLLCFTVNVTIRIMEILRNLSCGRLHLVGLQYSDSLRGLLLIPKGALNAKEEEQGKGMASPNSIYPQQLLTPKNFQKKIYNLT